MFPVVRYGQDAGALRVILGKPKKDYVTIAKTFEWTTSWSSTLQRITTEREDQVTACGRVKDKAAKVAQALVGEADHEDLSTGTAEQVESLKDELEELIGLVDVPIADEKMDIKTVHWEWKE